MRLRIGLLIVLALSMQTALQATDVSGSVSGVWDLAGSPYMVMNDVTVPTGQTLQISAGVHVLFTGHFKFIVNGNLQAIGTQQDSILFTRAYPTEESKWWGVRFYQSATESRLVYCVLEFGKADVEQRYENDGGAVFCLQCSLRVSNCTLRQSSATWGGGGLFVEGSSPTFSNCAILQNSASFYGGGALVEGVSSPRFSNCVISNNSAGANGGGVDCSPSVSTKFDNCTIVANTSSGGINAGDSHAEFNSDIIAFNTGPGVNGTSNRVAFCDFFGNSLGDIGGGPSGFAQITATNLNGDSCDQYRNIFLDPNFVNLSGGDYHLSAASRCINAGDTSLPRDGDGSVADIGAYSAASPRGLHLLAPNGGEIWHVSESDTIRWSGIGFTGNVRLELNRNYPGGGWETIAANTANDGSEPWVVTGPSSAHCRIRVSAVSDTLTDVSDADFTITATLSLVAPNGGEDWGVFQTDTVRWIGGGFPMVRIELNRNYPTGSWELLRDSTANDGMEAIFITDPLSTHCRVRISAIGDTLTAISAGDFSITASQGYLALARSASQSMAVLNWNPATLECPQVANEWFHLKNFGSEAIVVFQPLEPPSAEFSRTTTCGTFLALAPNQMSACSLRLTFAPTTDGTYRDTLLIQTDAVNGVGGYVKISLAGAQISTPAVPQIVIQPQGEDVHLAWQPITQSVGGCAVTVTRYLVFYSPTLGGPYYYHGYTAGTSYVHLGAVSYAGGMFYQVVAHAGATSLLDGILRGEEMGKVREKLKY